MVGAAGIGLAHARRGTTRARAISLNVCPPISPSTARPSRSPRRPWCCPPASSMRNSRLPPASRRARPTRCGLATRRLRGRPRRRCGPCAWEYSAAAPPLAAALFRRRGCARRSFPGAALRTTSSGRTREMRGTPFRRASIRRMRLKRLSSGIVRARCYRRIRTS